MGERLPLRGGPADGGAVPSAGHRRYVTADGDRGFKDPGPDRYLYVRARGEYIFAGVRARVCPACSVVSAVGDGACKLCGAATVPAHRRGAGA